MLHFASVLLLLGSILFTCAVLAATLPLEKLVLKEPQSESSLLLVTVGNFEVHGEPARPAGAPARPYAGLASWPSECSESTALFPADLAYADPGDGNEKMAEVKCINQGPSRYGPGPSPVVATSPRHGATGGVRTLNMREQLVHKLHQEYLPRAAPLEG